MIAALMWKEFREHIWKFLTLTAIVTAALIAAYASSRNYGPVILGLVMMSAWITPIWMSVATVMSENKADGMLFTIPAPRAGAWLIKTTFGVLTFLIPIELVGIFPLFYPIPNFDPDPENMWIWHAMLLGWISLYLMTIALTSGLRREISIAMWGMLIMLASCLGAAIVLNTVRNPAANLILLAVNPVGAFVYETQPQLRLEYHPLIYIQFALAVLWWFFGLRRFGAGSASVARPAPAASSGRRIILGKTSILRALAWREFREQAFIVVGVGVVGFLVALIISIANGISESHNNGIPATIATGRYFVEGLYAIGLGTPTIVAVVLGVGTWINDLEPRTMDFWRSRPFNPAHIFWSKFLSILFALFILFAAFLVADFICGSIFKIGGDSPRFAVEQLSTVIFAQSVWLSWIVSSAVLVTILARHPLYAALFTIILLLFVGLYPVTPHENLANLLFDGSPIAFLFFLLATIFNLGLAHLAITRNWRLTHA